ncbi:MAG: DUF4249 domain-containing protein [Cytophagales bacterium]|nr:DUF4249 domain-containing protein [Cytophagales bacterium]
MRKQRNACRVWHVWGYPLFMASLVFSCVYPYELEIFEDASALVVDATLTNETKAHLVQLTFTERLDSSRFRPVTSAAVNYLSNDARIPLREAKPGQYITDSSFAGIPGQAYQLEITLSNGQQYLSTEETLIAPVEIDSIYGRFLVVPADFNETNLDGVQIFLDSHSDATEHHNFRYEFQESYAVDVPYPSKYDHRGSVSEGNFEVFLRERPLGRCYRKRQQSRTLISTTRNLSENRISEYPLKFINEWLPDLAYDYRIGVRQYTISDDTYDFFRQLRDINESPGSLSDRQLGTLTGNIKPQEGTTLPVLGYFETAGVSEVRRTFSRHDFIDDGIQTFDWVCPLDSIWTGCTIDYELSIPFLFEREEIVDIIGEDTITRNVPYFDWGRLDGAVNGECEWVITDIRGQFAFVTWGYCGDCTWHGLYDKPEVWEDLP